MNRPTVHQQVNFCKKTLKRISFYDIGFKKRKLLNGVACKAEGELLRRALARYCGRVNIARALELLEDPSVFLCMKCQQILMKQSSLEAELFRINQQINVKCKTLIRSLNLPTIAAPTSPEAPQVEAGTSQLSVPTTPVSSNSPEVSVIMPCVSAIYFKYFVYY